MSFRCRIGWHNWRYTSPRRVVTIDTVNGEYAGKDVAEYQRKVCKRCFREIEHKVTA